MPGTAGDRGCGACPSRQLSQGDLSADEEPFLIFANRYYLRRLNLDGSNYTLLKQVPCWPTSAHPSPQAQSYVPCPTQPPPSPLLTPPATRVLILSSFFSPTPHIQGLNNAVALDFDYREQMIYWTDVTTQGSMIRRMHLNGSNVQVRPGQPTPPQTRAVGESRCLSPESSLCFKAVSPSPHASH